MSPKSNNQSQTDEERAARDLGYFLQMLAISHDPHLHNLFLKQETRKKAMSELIKEAKKQHDKVIKLSDKDTAIFRSLPDADNFKELAVSRNFLS